MSPRTVTDTIDGLEGRGLVTRGPHPSDRRITLLHLTEAAPASWTPPAPGPSGVAATAISDLNQHEQHTLQALLDRVGC